MLKQVEKMMAMDVTEDGKSMEVQTKGGKDAKQLEQETLKNDEKKYYKTRQYTEENA